jgi:hypothetical protein
LTLKALLVHPRWSALGEPLVSDIRTAPVASLRREVEAMTNASKAGLLKKTASALESKAVVTSEDLRVGLVKVAIALLPDSLPLIRTVIIDERNRYDPEVRFSLFCFLGEILGLSIGEAIEEEICDLVSTFLAEVRTNAAQAPWMAGDLLGSHWRAAPGVSALCEVAKEARFVVGREAAIHGLSHALERSPELHDSIHRVLNEIADADRSGRVRRYARSVLDGKHC